MYKVNFLWRCVLVASFATAAAVHARPSGDGPGAVSGHTARPVVTDLRPVLVTAIDSPSGEATAILNMGNPNAVGAQFHSNAPMNVDVSTLFKYAEAGCRRLRLHIWQEGVSLPGAAARDRTMDIELNHCRNGGAPRSLAREGAAR